MSGRMRDLCKVFLALLATLALLEPSYRFVRWRLDPEPIVPTAVGQFSPTLGWALAPNTSASSSRTGVPITYQINSKGLRDAETSYEKPLGTYRIALLGDSRTFGYGVPIEQHFSQLLEGYFERLEVINLGVSGYGVDQQLLALRGEGLRYEPDLVIAYVAHFGDHRHMHATRWGQAKPLFMLEHGKLVLTHVPVPDVSDGMDLPHRIDWYLSLRSPLYRDAARLFVVGIKHALGVQEPIPEQKQADNDSERDPAFMDQLHELANAILQEMKHESAAHGAAFAVITQVPRLTEACPRLGLMCLDTSLPLANPKYELPDGLQHINEAGNGVLAWELATFLRAKGLVAKEHWTDVSGAGPLF